MYFIFYQKTRPGWNGYMTNILKGSYPGKSLINILPIYSTLSFISKQTEQLNIPTPLVTLDQPLWLRATEIANKIQMNLVFFLGGFHTAVSFTGSTGALANDSGMQSAFETIFGKPISKAISKLFQNQSEETFY